ncbi:glycosyltransferase family 2 protein [Ruegeria sp. HKCCD7255]|uniref:glycosyltransferase family 2 protein n=1 Tax=Ruegeria sp. HKCCD7255 TaxID=2683004 RepID=UPI0014879714|nr:glycosyltransferase family 2 protein [Ruegeria sp. HKCCD7255]
MQYPTLADYLRSGQALAKGPLALIFAEDTVELDSTLRHYLKLGFKSITVFMPDAFDLAEDLNAQVHRVTLTCTPRTVVFDTINQIISAALGQWIHYAYNAEYLFYPYCESRSIGEMLSFHTEERRNAMMTHVVDLYAGDLQAHPNGVATDQAMMDKTGYYAHTRHDGTGQPLERQLDMSGGLRWRFEDHIPYERRRIDRIGLFKARKGLKILPDHTFNEPEYNTYACPWHHNMTAAICSFRAAKALKSNAGSTFDIPSFLWSNSIPFEWRSDQLLDLGLMEPGQWF